MKGFMNKIVKFMFLILVISIGTNLLTVKAQDKNADKTASFKGKLFRSDTNQPITNAQITLLDSKKSEKQNNSQEIKTDEKGNFSFDRVIAGKYTISIRVAYDKKDEVPCQFLIGKLKGEKESKLLVITEGNKKIYQVFIENFAVKANKNIEKEYDLACIGAFGN